MNGDAEAAKVPLVGNVISCMLSLVTFGVLSVCLTRRIQHVVKWKSLPLATWLILIIYIDSAVFVFLTAVIARGLGINESSRNCDGAILLCLICYLSTKVIIYYFLVERAYIVRGSRQSRLRTKLWVFNLFGMIMPYVAVIVMNFVFRIAYINDEGICIIGMEKIAMLPLISFDVVVNIYLTLLFIIPLRSLYTYQHNRNTPLHIITFRSFVGSCATLTSSVTNLTILMILKGEPGWICLMCCNADVLFSVLVLHWVTKIDTTRSFTGTSSQHVTADLERANNGHLNIPNLRRQNNASPEPEMSRVQATITTECTSVPPDNNGRGNKDEVVELDKIRVKTEHTREVEVEVGSVSENADYNTCNPEQSVSAEKMI